MPGPEDIYNSQSTLKDNTQAQEEEPTPVFIKPEKEHDLANWVAPARPFKRRNREFYVTVISIAAIVGLILFLVEGWVPVVLLISLVFLFYVMNTVEPENIEYRITTKGIKIAEKLTEWPYLGRFWFSRRFDSELLIIETARLPGRLELVINPELKTKIREGLAQYLKEEEVPPSYLDKAAGWFSKKLPGNN